MNFPSPLTTATTWTKGALAISTALLMFASLVGASFFVSPASAHAIVSIPACDLTPETTGFTTFDTFSVGDVNGQNTWSSTGSYDQEVVQNIYGFSSFGCQSLRLSNAVTTGGFGDQTFSSPAPATAGESSVASNNHYEAQFDIASTMFDEQSELFISVSPDDGNGSRMSYLGFSDEADGIHVIFYDVTNPGPLPAATSWNDTEVAVLDRSVPHTAKFVIDFVDGPANDVVKIYIDGTLVHTGTTWEDYYRYDSEQNGNGNQLFPIDTLIFRAGGTAVPSTDGEGYLFDNVSVETSNVIPDDTPPEIFVKGSPEWPNNEGWPHVGDLGTKTFCEVSFKLHDNVAVDYFTINGEHFPLTDNEWSDANFDAIGVHFVDGENTLVVFDTAGNSSSYTFTLGNCSVEPAQCSVTIVSDTTNSVTEKGANAVLAWAHTAWTAVIDSASWIWGTEYVEAPTTTETQTFVKTFEWSGPIDSAVLNVAADNYYSVTLNGNPVGSELLDENNFQAGTQDPYDVSSFVIEGVNTLEIVVTNKAVANSSATSNPAGLKYNLTIVSTQDGDACMSAPVLAQCEAGVELLQNGSFENPVVTASQKWNIFPSGTIGLEWIVDWFGNAPTYNSSDLPDTANLELHKGVNGWLASDGLQYAELDTDWFGPSNPLNGEPASTAISQTVATKVGENYTFSFDFSPRPGTAAAENKVEVLANGTVIGTVGPNATAGNQTEWSDHEFDFVATTTSTTFALRDAGTPKDSLGTFVDNASLMCVPQAPQCVDEPDGGWSDAVAGYEQGKTKAGSDVSAGRSDTSVVPGTPDWTPGSGTGFYSLGFGGWITVSFDSYVPNVPGDDISIHEATNGVYPSETAKIEVSQTGEDGEWYEVGTAGNNGVSYFDFDSTGLDWIKYVRVTDTTNPSLHISTADGFDLAAVDATQTMCNEPEPTHHFSTVTMCKTDLQANGLEGWTLALLDAPVDSFQVPANTPLGHDSISLTGGTSYVALAGGVWLNDRNPDNFVDPEYSTEFGNSGTIQTDWSGQTIMDGFTGYGENILDLQIAQQFVNWGTYNNLHQYATAFVPGSDGSVNFRVFDGNADSNTPNAGWYGDNSGSLDVAIHSGFAGVTDQTGCVTFTDVPYGSYTAVEQPQDGWTQVETPTNPVTVDSPSQTFTFVNELDGPEESVITLPENDYDSFVQGPVPLAAFYADENGDGNDGVQWAVRYGSCSASTVFGNVDGHTDSFVWDGADFSATFDALSAVPGDYCFVFNPTEDSGDANQRLTRWFTVTAAPLGAPTLTIVKNSDGLIGDFEWLVSSLNTSQTVSTTTTVDGFATTTVTLGEEATFTVTETTSSSWSFEGASCTFVNGDPVIGSSATDGYQFNAEDGDDIICHFDNVTNCNVSEYYDESEKQCEPRDGWSVSDLSITKEVETDGTPVVGEPAVYTITVTNSGPDTATNVVVNDNLPVGVSWISHDIYVDEFTDLADDAYDENTGIWTILSIGNGVTLTLDIVVEIGETGSISNTATVEGSSNSYDPNTDDNSASAEFTAGEAEDGPGPSSTQTSFFGGGGITTLGVGGSGLVLGASTSTGEVLGESCGLYLGQHLRRGYAGNDSGQVTKLQQFLNDHGFGILSLTGIFGAATESAVKDFQQTYANEILAPWGISEPTGLVYLTTLRQINLIECPHLSLQIPPLVTWGDGQTGGNSSVADTSSSSEGNNDEGQDEGSSISGGDNGTQSASAGSAVKGQGGFWSKIWNMLFGR